MIRGLLAWAIALFLVLGLLVLLLSEPTGREQLLPTCENSAC